MARSDPRLYNVVPNDTGDPHRRLAAAVLLRAALDVRGVKLALQTGQRRDKVQRDALEWLHSDEAVPWAELVDVDPAWLRRVR